MHDAELVNVLDAGEDLGVHLAGLWLLQSPIFDDVLEKLAARTVLHDQVEVVIVFNHLRARNKQRKGGDASSH